MNEDTPRELRLLDSDTFYSTDSLENFTLDLGYRELDFMNDLDMDCCSDSL